LKHLLAGLLRLTFFFLLLVRFLALLRLLLL
jgi:hypothetical protein